MKQLFIVSNTTAVAESAADAAPGQLIVEQLETLGVSGGDPTVFNIGLMTNYGARLIEVNLATARTTLTVPALAVPFQAEATIPTPTDATDYTLTLIKKGAVLTERYKWTATDYVPAGVVKSDFAVAYSLGKQLYEKTEGMGVLVGYPSADGTKMYVNGVEDQGETPAPTVMVKITSGEPWTLVGGDALAGAVTIVSEAKPAVCDGAYLKNLASQCAAGKGFNYVDGDGKEIYPGYPEPIADNSWWHIWNIRFATTRLSGHQLDEPIYQYLHIAIPDEQPQA